MASIRVRSAAAVSLCTVVGMTALLLVPSSSASVGISSPIGYGSTEIANPLRGQHENMLTALFPQSNASQSSYPAWPSSYDRSDRIEWKALQPKDPATVPAGAPDDQRFDFTRIDRGLADAAAQGKRFAFRVTSFNSCCDAAYPNNVNSSVPEWLRRTSGATKNYSNGGVVHVVPDWNSDSYLRPLESLLAALGARYNKDERLAWFEFSGYGDWSENHVAFMRDQLGAPGPAEQDSVARLGYYSQYRDQYITKAAVDRLVYANLHAFADSQIIVAPGNPEIVRQAMRDSSQIARLARPVGNRSDCLGAYSAVPTWAESQYSHYVQTGDPLVQVMRDQWRRAPVVTEWCNFIPSGTKQQYYEKAVRDVVNSHVSVTSSTGFPDQFATARMDPALYGLWSKANKFSGYRYAMTSASVPDVVASNATVPVSVGWTNVGSAPTYERWQVVYEVRNSGGAVVRTLPSSLDLRTLYAEQNYSDVASDPTSKSIVDSVSIATNGLAAGAYTVVARVVWNEHKSGGTNVVNFAPMALAQNGRDAGGAYPVGGFTSRAAAPTTSAGATTTMTTTPPPTTTVRPTTTTAVPPVTTTTTTTTRGGFCPPTVRFCR